jgi:hypothetical protein
MPEDNTTFVIAFCTGQLMKCDMVVNALKEAGIPHQVRAETATGLKLAMPITPAPGPGRFFTLLVPADAEAKAQAVLSQLPFEITANPGPWDFEPRPTAKRWWKVVLIGVLMLYALFWIMILMGLLK